MTDGRGPDTGPEPTSIDDPSTWDDERWDREADAELDALAQSIEPGASPRWEAPVHFPPPPRVYDRRLAVLTADGVGEFVRACRAAAGLSQRQVAEASGVSQASIARIEAGRAPGVTVATLVRLADACDLLLVGTAGSHAPMLETDLAQRHCDRAGRLLPAHLVNAPYESRTLADARRGRRGLPARTYRHVRVRDVPDT